MNLSILRSIIFYSITSHRKIEKKNNNITLIQYLKMYCFLFLTINQYINIDS